MTAWFKGLGQTAKVLVALTSIAVASVTIGFALSEWPGLPAQVEVNTANITEIQRTLGGILCILTQPEGANPLDCI